MLLGFVNLKSPKAWPACLSRAVTSPSFLIWASLANQVEPKQLHQFLFPLAAKRHGHPLQASSSSWEGYYSCEIAATAAAERYES